MTGNILLMVAMALAVAGAGWDIRTRRIPNWLVVLLGLSAVAASVILGGWPTFGWAIAHALIVLVVGMGLFALRAIGAGDAKFYSAAALAVPLDRALPMLGWVSLAGLVLVLAMVAWHRGLKVVRDGKKTSWTLPYGVPICCGFVIEALRLMGQSIF